MAKKPKTKVRNIPKLPAVPAKAPRPGAQKRQDVAKLATEAERRIAAAKDPAEALGVERELDTIETMMKNSGLYTPDELREINEFRMRARYRLGGLLAKVERGAGPGRGKKKDVSAPSFLGYLKEIELDKARAIEAQRIATMPKADFEKALVANHKAGALNTVSGLVKAARKFWFKAARQAKHKKISMAAAAAKIDVPIGPFPLVYADPPTQFLTYTEAGMDRAPDAHYETLTDSEIQNFKIGDKKISEIAHKDAALFLWCTSSNIHRALQTIEAWGFTFKASAVWIKEKEGVEQKGMGQIFINEHEVLLYGMRGKMPGPQYSPPSVFRYPRGEHSAKPPEIRAEIEKMYPDFDASQRLELFANSTYIPGWTVYGKPHAADDAPTTDTADPVEIEAVPKPKRSHKKKPPVVELVPDTETASTTEAVEVQEAAE